MSFLFEGPFGVLRLDRFPQGPYESPAVRTDWSCWAARESTFSAPSARCVRDAAGPDTCVAH